MEAGRVRSVEGRGKTVDDAILDALTKLGASREAVDIEVLSEGTRGVWGIGAEDARVRAAPKSVRPAAPKAAPRPQRAPEPEPELPAGASDEEVARHVVSMLVSKMGLEAEVEVSAPGAPADAEDNPPAIVNIKGGDDLTVLIGRRGETLRDLQFITRLIVSRKVGHWPNIVVDVQQYRRHREQALTQLAHRMADKVRLTKQSVPLEPMPPHERRIIHLALRDDPNVMTESTGEGEARKVVLMLRHP